MQDSHIHLAMEPLRSNFDELIQRFEDTGGRYILTLGTDFEDFETTLQTTQGRTKVGPLPWVLAGVGLHPTFFEEIPGKEKEYIEKFERFFREKIEDISAVGETGLDYYRSSANIEIQKLSFKRHIELALEFDLPISIHARDMAGEEKCIKDVIDMVAKHGKGILRGSFHSYTGSIDLAKQIWDLGFHMGFNAIITYNSGENVREVLKQTPINKILFETDGPFLPPQSVRKNKNIKEKFAEPSHVREIMEKASEVLDIPVEILEKQTDENFRDLFRLSQQKD